MTCTFGHVLMVRRAVQWHVTDGIVHARGESTRAAILAAAALISDLGWGGVSTRAIAERAKVTHGR